MTKLLTKARRYRFHEDTWDMLEQLKAMGVRESAFVRQSIEKFERDMPELKRKLMEDDLPF